MCLTACHCFSVAAYPWASSKLQRGFAAFERNTGAAHPSDKKLLKKRATGSVPLTDDEDGALWQGGITVGTPAVAFTGTSFISSIILYLHECAVDFDTGKVVWYLKPLPELIKGSIKEVATCSFLERIVARTALGIRFIILHRAQPRLTSAGLSPSHSVMGPPSEESSSQIPFPSLD